MPLRVRAWINRLRRGIWRLLFFRMLFGERAADGRLLPLTRISPSTCFEHPEGLVLADDVFIGHFNVIEALHGVRIEDGALIGMGAVLLGGSVIGAEALVAAGAVVREGFEVPSGMLVAGVPAKVIRALTPEERKHFRASAEGYVKKLRLYLG